MDQLPVEVPFQIEKLINDMMSKSERLHIRNNYRNRLDVIRVAIDKSIKKFDNEYSMSMMNTGNKKAK